MNEGFVPYYKEGRKIFTRTKLMSDLNEIRSSGEEVELQTISLEGLVADYFFAKTKKAKYQLTALGFHQEEIKQIRKTLDQELSISFAVDILKNIVERGADLKKTNSDKFGMVRDFYYLADLVLKTAEKKGIDISG